MSRYEKARTAGPRFTLSVIRLFRNEPQSGFVSQNLPCPASRYPRSMRSTNEPNPPEIGFDSLRFAEKWGGARKLSAFICVNLRLLIFGCTNEPNPLPLASFRKIAVPFQPGPSSPAGTNEPNPLPLASFRKISHPRRSARQDHSSLGGPCVFARHAFGSFRRIAAPFQPSLTRPAARTNPIRSPLASFRKISHAKPPSAQRPSSLGGLGLSARHALGSFRKIAAPFRPSPSSLAARTNPIRSHWLRFAKIPSKRPFAPHLDPATRPPNSSPLHPPPR